ncbi:hypothetical protein SCRDD08_01750 [Streptococcus cristatus]|uniref:Uncharacterized protein n=1 Tax=Streptococcus cristatus TaxID=45634 RepID=A0A139MYV0_STRCR|nr:hypothetical protein SCRDD08_01750 [Streptococcus cristatus]
MISSFSLRFIRVTGLAIPATKKKLFVFKTFLFYQEAKFLSNLLLFQQGQLSFINQNENFSTHLLQDSI